jgi:transposase
LPKLRRGDVLIMDNLKAHHDDRVRPLCRTFGVNLLYLPPYSPDLNPMVADEFRCLVNFCRSTL